MQCFPTLCRHLVYAWPLVLTAGPLHAAADWVDAHTKAFVMDPQLLARGATNEVAPGQTADVLINPKLRNEVTLKALAHDVNDPRNPYYCKYLISEQFLVDHAPTQAQVDAVMRYLRQNSFTDIDVAPSRLLISTCGTVGTVKAASNTPLVHYQPAGRSGFANSGGAQVSRVLGGIVGPMLGLQNVACARPLLRVGDVAEACTLAAGTAAGHYPREFPTLYGTAGVPTAAGAMVGVITIGGISQTLRDLRTFTSNNGYAAASTTTIKINGISGNYIDDQEGQGEWNLDSQFTVGTTGDAVGKLAFYIADLNAPGNTGLTKAFDKMVTDNTAKITNVSLGWRENDASADGTLDAEEAIFTTAAAQGQTFPVSSGGEGVYECNSHGYPDGINYSVSWPVSSPHVLAIGGTTLYTNGSSSASETVWNEGLDGNDKLWATGGGISQILPAPSWQDGNTRLLPDVSFDATQSTGAYIYNYRQLQQIGGTGLALSIFVGFQARLLAANDSLGLPAACLYSATPVNMSLLRYDAILGNNGYQDYGYNAAKGWDYPTGQGSLNIDAPNQLIKSGGLRCGGEFAGGPTQSVSHSHGSSTMSLPRLTSGASMRVPFVEDDDMIGDNVRKGLCHDGFAIDWVRDGEATVHTVTAPGAASAESGSTLFDLVLLDFGLLKRDGLDVVREACQRGIAIPILVLITRDAAADCVVGFSAGADNYLVKPSDLQELAARMHTLLRRQGGRADPLMRHGEVLLNLVVREVLRVGVSVKLSGREFAVLHALLTRPGKVWSITQLQDNLYGWGEEVGSNTVEVYIHALRRKLGSHFIQDIRGVGYVIPRETSTSPVEPVDSDAHQ